MATQVKRRRGSQVEIDGFTPAVGEIVVNTSSNELVIGNGAKQGGFPIPRKDNTMLSHATLAAAVADASLKEGDSTTVKERIAGTGRGGAAWDVVLASSVTTNTYNIVQCTGAPTLALVLRLDADRFHVDEWGAKPDDNTFNNTPVIQAVIDYLSTTTDFGGFVDFGSGIYWITQEIYDNDKTIVLRGRGVNFDDAQQGKCTIIKVNAAVNGFRCEGNFSGAEHLCIEGIHTNGETPDLTLAAIKSYSANGYLHNVMCRDYLGHGFWWADGNVSYGAKLSVARTGGDGFRWEDEAGAPIDINGSHFFGMNARITEGDGFHIVNGFGINVHGARAEGCEGYGINIESDQNHFIGVYVENNDSGGGNYDVHFGTGAARNKISHYYTANSSQADSVFDEGTNFDNSVDSVQAYFDLLLQARELQVGRRGGGIAGQLLMKEGSTNFEWTLEGTGGNQKMIVKSAGAGRFDFEFEDRLTVGNRFGLGNVPNNTNTPSGPTAKAMPVYDTDGETLLGYAPLYSSQW